MWLCVRGLLQIARLRRAGIGAPVRRARGGGGHRRQPSVAALVRAHDSPRFCAQCVRTVFTPKERQLHATHVH